MRIQNGSGFIRLSLVRAANFGSNGGTATVDRPVAIDPWHGLPYIPSSSLKGVIAGRWGNVASGSNRAKVFGEPDADNTLPVGGWTDRGAQVVFGDGELLCFPLPLLNHEIAWVFPAVSLVRLAKLVGFPYWDGIAQLSDWTVAGSVSPSLLPGDLRSTNLRIAPRRLSQLLGRPLPARSIVAGPEAVRFLWLNAVEDRTLTAVDEVRQVISSSLRRVELIPAGTVFLSYITSRGDCDIPDLDHLQVGAWESIGCGYLEVEKVDLNLASDSTEAEELTSVAQPAMTHERPDQIMQDMFRLISSVAQEEELATKVRSAIRASGPRWRNQGLASTLAFSLSKAGLAKTGQERGVEARAHEWFLRAVLNAADSNRGALSSRVASIIAGEQEPSTAMDQRWQWLRRYSESILPAQTQEE